MDWYKILYYVILYGSYLLYGFLLLAIVGGLPNVNMADKIPEYLNVLQNSLKYYVCFFLIIRFNPFTRSRGSEFTEFDADVVFSSAIFLILTTSFTSVVYTYVTKYITNPIKTAENTNEIMENWKTKYLDFINKRK
jgi:hypothetical protein